MTYKRQTVHTQYTKVTVHDADVFDDIRGVRTQIHAAFINRDMSAASRRNTNNVTITVTLQIRK